ncbi:Peptidoglycan-associated lipoprotein [Arenibacter antarcticus]|uniref:OmpA family protein n=1 Tax=Arenibacter antarcticus TaxID=2040469 RepID=A0ABW5VBN3_9FLAO|nr:OmpA family protein [Arenibacter sp. H213]MCM4169331.1 cell envelope biogenesis protein OmpA [Arenibacter sp. H213]
MRFWSIFLFLLIFPYTSFAQQKRSKGDISFFEYSYRKAIKEYQKELEKGSLTSDQYLNLADSYLKVGNFKNASKIYVDIFKKDTIMTAHHFNMLLQSIARTSGMEEVKAFLGENKQKFSRELLENTEFNYELLQLKNELALTYEIFNVSSNSPQADFSPAFFKDKVLFSSARPGGSKKVYSPSGESYLNIYEAEVDSNGDMKAPREFGGLKTSKFHKSTPFYSEELKSLFYSLSNAVGSELLFSANGKNSMSIAMSSGSDAYKYILRDLDTSFYYPFYEAATGRLFFAANFEDSYGGTDLYFVYTNDGIIMSSPVNLGPRINTPGNEIAPFIFENTLYFASDVFYGLGGMDIYKSNLQDYNNFSIPVNLGTDINSKEDDFGLIIKNNDTNGLLGYFASNRYGGKGNDDVYGFKVDEKPGLKTLAFKGKVQKPNDGIGIGGAVVTLSDDEGTVLKEVTTDGYGNYQLEIPWRHKISLKAEKERYSTYLMDFNSEELDKMSTSKFNLELVLIDDILSESEAQVVIKMNKFYFNKGRAEISPEIAMELEKVVAAIKSFPKLQLRIESHTDSRGGSSYNFTLSQKRSNAIENYLLEQGVPKSNILYAVGYGEEKILNNCKNGVFCLEMLHNKNERSLVVVLNYNVLF